MYNSIHELPSQVLSSLDEKDAEHWMKAYNECNPITPEEIKKAKKIAWYSCKDLPSSFSFRIKASMDAVDKDREIIDLDSIKKHMDSYIDYGGPLQWEHGNYTVGNIWDWKPIKEGDMDGIVAWGNLYGGDQVYDKMRESFVKGKNALSVAGEADMGKFQCDERGCYTRRFVKQLLEISLCAIPANKFCKMEWYNENAKMTKSAKNEIRFNVSEYEIHKSYNECPVLKLKKSLNDIGYDAYATEVGVFVPMSKESFKKTLPHMHENNLHVIWVGNGVMLNDNDYLREISFKKGYSEGYIGADGKVLPSITEKQFKVLAERDVLREGDDAFFIKEE